MTGKTGIPTATKTGSVPVIERLKTLDRNEFFAVLATDEGNQPYTSLVNFAVTPDQRQVLFVTPKQTRKYRNILTVGNVALLVDNRSKRNKRLMETEAITVIGKARAIKKGKRRDELANIFLKKHPDLEEFMRSPATALVAITITRCIHVSEFQTVTVMDYHPDIPPRSPAGSQ